VRFWAGSATLAVHKPLLPSILGRGAVEGGGGAGWCGTKRSNKMDPRANGNAPRQPCPPETATGGRGSGAERLTLSWSEGEATDGPTVNAAEVPTRAASATTVSVFILAKDILEARIGVPVPSRRSQGSGPGQFLRFIRKKRLVNRPLLKVWATSREGSNDGRGCGSTDASRARIREERLARDNGCRGG
jgi:hypothetical protein